LAAGKNKNNFPITEQTTKRLIGSKPKLNEKGENLPDLAIFFNIMLYESETLKRKLFI